MWMLATAFALVGSGTAIAKDRLVETIRQDVDGDGKPDRIVLSLTSEPNGSGDFDRIALFLSASHKRFMLQGDDLWTRFDDPDAAPRRPVASLLRSRRMLLVKSVEGANLLIAVGFPYSTGQRLTIIRVNGEGARLVLNEDMNLQAIGDIDHDGRTDVVGAMISESLGTNCHSYDPDVVYTLRNVFRFNRPLTEQFDRKRDGFYAADGKHYIVLERHRGRKVLLLESERSRCD